MEKLDLKKDLKALYLPSAKKVERVDVPSFQFLMIDGAIEPGQSPGNSPLFAENMQALDVVPKLTPSVMGRIDEILGNKPEPESDYR